MEFWILLSFSLSPRQAHQNVSLQLHCSTHHHSLFYGSFGNEINVTQRAWKIRFYDQLSDRNILPKARQCCSSRKKAVELSCLSEVSNKSENKINHVFSLPVKVKDLFPFLHCDKSRVGSVANYFHEEKWKCLFFMFDFFSAFYFQWEVKTRYYSSLIVNGHAGGKHLYSSWRRSIEFKRIPQFPWRKEQVHFSFLDQTAN